MTVYAELDSEGKMRFECPSCGKVLKLPAGQGGNVKCPRERCGLRFEVRPTPSPTPNAAPLVIASTSPRARFAGEPPRATEPNRPAPLPADGSVDVSSSNAMGSRANSFPWVRLGLVLGVVLLVVPSGLLLVYDVIRSWNPPTTLLAFETADSNQVPTPPQPPENLSPPAAMEPAPAPDEITESDSPETAEPLGSLGPAVASHSPSPLSSIPASPALQNPSVPQPATPSAQAVSLGDAEILQQLQRLVRVSGTLVSESVTQYQGADSMTFQQWTSALTLTNDADFDLSLGDDLLLVELPSEEDGSYEGFGVFEGTSEICGPRSYGLINNYETIGQRQNIGNGYTTITFLGTSATLGGTIERGEIWKLDREFPEYSWIIEPAGAEVVFPEIQVSASSGIKRFRLVAHFDPPVAGETWTLKNQRWIPIESTGLTQILSDTSESELIRVLAANQLAEHFPDSLTTPLVSACKDKEEGQLLASALTLLTSLNRSGLESQALTLLQDRRLPNGIRAFSADYLGVMKYSAGHSALKREAKGDDSVVGAACVRALGRLGDSESVDAIIDLMEDNSTYLERRVFLDALAMSGSEEANRRIQQLATDGDYEALDALAYSGHESNWTYFEKLANGSPATTQKGLIARGLWQTGSERALPLVLKLLDDRAFHDEANYDASELSSVISLLESQEAIDGVLPLAKQGNLRAAEGLAGMYIDAVKQPLRDLANSTHDGVRRIALDALSNRWPKESVDLFAVGLESPSAAVVEASIRGIQASEDPRALERLIPLLKHREESVRQAVVWAMEVMPIDDQIDEFVPVFLNSSDGAVISMGSRKLLEAGWKDASLIPDLSRKLSQVDEYQAYDLVKLLRHVSDNALGPETDDEWYSNPNDWIERWKTWARSQ